MAPAGEPTRLELTQTKAEKQEVTKLAILLFDHIEGQIKSADTKVLLTLSANGILANLSKDLSEGMVYKLLNSSNRFEQVAAFFTILMFVSLLVSVYNALRVVKPILTAPARQTPFYFGNIKQQSEDEFINKFQDQRPDEICASILAQVYAKAKIVHRKHVGLGKSLYFFFAALLWWAIAQLLIAFTP